MRARTGEGLLAAFFKNSKNKKILGSDAKKLCYQAVRKKETGGTDEGWRARGSDAPTPLPPRPKHPQSVPIDRKTL